MCSGTELTLLDCSYSYDSTGDENDHSRDVIVHCRQRKFEICYYVIGKIVLHIVFIKLLQL